MVSLLSLFLLETKDSMPFSSPPTLIPLNLVKLKCAECRDQHSCADLNADTMRFFYPDKSIIRFPEKGLTKEEADQAKHLELYCECCMDKIQ